MDVIKYIQEYNFSNYTEEFKEKTKEKSSIQKYLKTYPEENFMKFSEEFWENPSTSIEELKAKYYINRQIAYSDIIKAYPTEKYMKFLNIYYTNPNIEELIHEFLIPYNRIEQIIIPIILDSEEMCCPQCFKSIFEIKSNDNSYIYICQNCMKRLNDSELLTREQAEHEIKKNADKKVEFDEKMNHYETILDDIKCPKCQEKLYLNRFNELYSYKIYCKKCRYSSYDIEKTVVEYQTWKQRAAMMIAIKAKEQELIEKALQNKREQDVVFNKEDIIKTEENEKTFEFFKSSLSFDSIQVWGELFKRIKVCNRLEKKALIELIELTKSEGEKKILDVGKEELKLYAYMPKEPLIYNLISKTKIIVIRQLLRRLMKYNLIISSEEVNYILIHELLVNNIESIKNLIIVKDINPQVRYLVLQRQNFTCMTCGETGRPLEIAYLTSDKNINDLSSLIALCDYCHEITTRNDILIDGTITFEVDYLDKNNLKSHEFLTTYYPELKNEESIRRILEDWENDFNVSDIIKALTITIDRIKRNKIEGTINSLLSYTNGILKKTAETGNPVNIYENIKEQYGLNKWIEE